MLEQAPRKPHSSIDSEVELLRRQNQYKAQLLNSVAHELSTPLTPVRLQLRLLHDSLKDRLEPADARAFEILERNIDRLTVIVREIVDVARLDATQFTLRLETVDLGELLDEVAETFQAMGTRLGVAFERNVPHGLFVLGDRQRLLQVLQGLLNNAFKFTPRGGTVQVEGHALDGDCEFIVRDTGVGFSPADADRLFRPFSQLGPPITGSFQGAGLGLYISKGIIELHEGSLWGSSRGPGQGAEFGFRLRRVDPSAAQAIVSGLHVRERELDFAERIRNLI